MKKHFNIGIFGRVQGIFFRATAKEQADLLGIVGFAQNKDDGSVYIEAEGEENQLNKFLKWCYLGPPLAQVERVIASEGSPKNFKDFEVY